MKGAVVFLGGGVRVLFLKTWFFKVNTSFFSRGLKRGGKWSRGYLSQTVTYPGFDCFQLVQAPEKKKQEYVQ